MNEIATPTEMYNIERDKKIRELDYKQKIEVLIEKELLPEYELIELLYNSDLTVKELKEITGN